MALAAHAVKDAAAAPRAPAGAYFSGVLVSQLANNALHLAQPLLLLELSGSFGVAAFFSAFDTAVHMGGTFLGGWPADRLGARKLLVISTLGRGLSLALIPAALVLGKLTLPFAMAAYTLDALVRGLTDTAAHTVPLELGRGRRADYDRLNSGYELAFDLGGTAGPLMLGALLAAGKTLAVQLAIPAGFVLAALVFIAIPEAPAAERSRERKRAGSWEGLKLVLADPRLRLACAGLCLLNLYPLRKLMASFFAKAILQSPAAAGWVGAAFGLGGAAGAVAYALRSGGGAGWVAAGAVGSLALAAGWLPASLSVMIAAALLFSLANVGARLALTRRLQEATPLESAGGVTAVARFGSNGVSVGLKTLVGAAFAVGAGPKAAFGLIAGGLVLLAAAQLGLCFFLKKES